jgi:YidC/Oxa1 family membrane protein insertase
VNFDLTFSFMLPILKWFATQTHSWGWAIIGLTVLVRILVAPLVQSSTLQMRKMSQLQPQMAALQAKYKEDPEQLQKKMMEFYGKNKMNPMGGCLPMLVQLPILFALYGAFSGPPFVEKSIDVPIKIVAKADAANLKSDIVSKNTVPYVAADGDLSKIAVYPGETAIVEGSSIDFGTRPVQGTLKGELKVKWKLVPKGEKDPSKLPEFSDTRFATPTNLAPGEYQIQCKVPAIASGEPFGFITSLGKVAKGLELIDPKNWDVLFLILAFGVTTYLSSLFSTGGSPQVPNGEMTEQQLIQKQTMKMMPVTMTVMFCFIPLPAGVFLYFVVSNLFQVIQTWWITKQPTPVIVSLDGDEPGDSKGGSGGSGVKRSGGGPKEGPSGRSKGPTGGKSTDSSGGSPATISSNSGPKAGIAATTTSGSTLDISDPDKRKAKKKKK